MRWWWGLLCTRRTRWDEFAISLKQQSADRHVASLGHIILIPSQPVFALSPFSAISWREQVNFQWDDEEVHFVLDQYAESDFYSASSLKQQSADRHVNKSFNINKTSSHLSSQIIEHIKDHLHDVGNACSGLGSKHSRIKPVNRIPTLLSCIYICTI
jgi:hypothetical protein